MTFVTLSARYRGPTIAKERFCRARGVQVGSRLRRVGGFGMTKAKLVLAAIIVLVVIISVGCGGPSTCPTGTPGAPAGSAGGASGGSTPPPSGCSLTGTGGTDTGIYLMVADAGGIQGEFADITTKKMEITPNFGTVSVSTPNPGDWLLVAQQKFMYGAYTDIGQIYGWGVDGSGLLTALNPPNISAPYLTNTQVVGTNLGTSDAGWQGMITNPAGTLLFVVDQTPGSEAIEIYQIGTSGLLSGPTKTLLPSGFVPYNLAIDGQGKYLYVSNVSGFQTSSIMAYSFDANGALTPVPNSPFPAVIQQMQGEASGKYMIGTSGNVFGNDSSLYIASIQPDGELMIAATPVLGQPIEVTVQPNSGGNLVYAMDFPSGSSNSGTVEGFTFDASTGTLTEMANSPFASVLGAHGEFDSSGKIFFFSTSTSASRVALYSFDVTTFPDLSTPLASVGWAPGAWTSVDGH